MKILPRAKTMNGPGNATYKKDAELNWDSLDTSARRIYASPHVTPVNKMLCELSSDTLILLKCFCTLLFKKCPCALVKYMVTVISILNEYTFTTFPTFNKK